MEFGFLALLPPLAAIILAFITRNVLLSLFSGVFIGATMISGWNPILGFVNTVGNYIIPSMGDSWNASVILMTLFVGVFSALIEKGGGAVTFGKSMRKKIQTRKQAQLYSWFGGILVFFSDSSNSVLIGPILKPITDRLKVSREKLAYICDSTASSIPLLLPITAWGAFIMGVYKDQFPEGTNLMEVYIKSMPYNLYTIVAVLLVGIIAITGWDFGPMRKAEERAKRTGKVLADGAEPLKKELSIDIPEDANVSIWNMILPLVVLITTLFTVFLWTGGFPEKSFLTAISNADTMLGLSLAFFVGAIVSSLMIAKSKVLNGSQIKETWTEGFAQMIEAVLILILSWSIGSVTKEVGTADYIVAITKDVASPSMMYVAIFIAACITAFATGTSWGTFAIFLPIAIPLAFGSDISVYPAIGSALAGGLFGDHCSPISDSTILASLGASSDHLDHVKTQMPYAISVAIASIFGYIVAAITNNSILALGVTLVITIGIVYLLYKIDSKKDKDLLEEANQV